MPGQSMLSKESIAILVSLTFGRFEKYFEMTPLPKFSILKVFENVGESTEPRKRESIPFLLRCLLQLLHFQVSSRHLHLIKSFCDDLLDTDFFLHMLDMKPSAQGEEDDVSEGETTTTSQQDARVSQEKDLLMGTLPKCDSKLLSPLQRAQMLLGVYEVLTVRKSKKKKRK
jgi:hypothetical protein